MRRLLWLALLVGWLPANPAWAYLGTLQSLGQMTGDAKHIVVLEVDRVSREKKVIIWKKVADLKGNSPTNEIKHLIQSIADSRESESILNWAEPGETAIFFQSGTAAVTCIGCCWYQCAQGQEAPWWTMTRIQFEESYAYMGSPRKLRRHVTAILNSQEVVVTALDRDELIPYRYTALRDVPRGAQYPVWRIKAGLNITSWPKAGEPGAGGPEDVMPLVEALKSKDPRERADAAFELGGIGSPARQAAPALVQALKDPEGLVRVRAAEALAKVDLDNQDALPALIERLKDKDSRVRNRAAEALGDLGPAARAAVPALSDALKDTDPRLRSSAAAALGQVGPRAKAAVPALIEGLKDEALRSSAAGALGAIGPEARDAVPALTAALKNADGADRWTIVGALARIGGPEATAAVPILRSAILGRNDTDRECYHALILLEFLGPVGKDAAPAVVDGLKSSRLQPGWASTTLHRIDLEAAMPFLLAHLKGPDQALRKYAAAALGYSGPRAKEALPLLLTAAREDSEPEVARIAAWAVALIREDYKTAAPLLIQALKGDRSSYNHQFSNDALRRWGPEAREAVPVLAEALLDKNVKVRRAAASVLGQIGPEAKSAAPTLRKLLQDDDRAVRLATADAVEKVTGTRE